MVNSYDSVVNSFYLAFYGRPADTAGLAYWSAQLQDANGNFNVIANAFATSEEAIVRFGTDSVGERIATIYQQLFNRAPDAAGLHYWTEAVESGRTTLAMVTMEILKGAQGSDVTISDARQYAAEKFTQSVGAAGVDFNGYAAIEASRALIAAVSADTGKDGIDAMVKVAGGLVDVAHDNPEVIDALASGGKLTALFATARGQAEPQNLLQALADLARTAAGDPVTLESLLRGGGMNKVLEVMPHSATLHDVVDALGSGGLPAAVEVVYPSAPVQAAPAPAPAEPVPAPAEPLPMPAEPIPTPAEPIPMPAEPLPTPSEPAPVPSEPIPTPSEPIPTPSEPAPTPAEPLPVIDPPAQTFTFTTISQSQGDSASVAGTGNPLATNLPMAVVNALMSAELQPRQQIQYSLDKGLTWEVRDAYGIGDKVWIENVPTSDHASLMLRVVDLDTGLAGQAATQAIVYDGEAPVVGSLVFVGVTEGERDTQHDKVTNVALASATLRIDGAQPAAGEQLQYSLDGAQWTGSGLQLDPETGRITIDKLDLAQGALASDGTRLTTLQVRAIDAAGNTTVVGSQDLVYDNEVKAPVVVLAKDTGISATDTITYSGGVKISGLDSGSAWEYALDGGDLVKGEGAVDGKATLSLSGDGAHSVLVRMYDAAGNVNRARLDFTLDATKPVALPAFDHVEGATTVANATGLSKAEVVFKYEGSFDAGDLVEYRTDTGGWTRSDSILVDQDAHTITLRDVDLSTSDPFIAVRVVDTAGNQGVEAGVTIDGPYGNPKISTTVTPKGLEVTSSIDATMYLKSKGGTLTEVLSTLGGGAVAGGTVLLGAQAAGLTGTLVLKTDAGEFADPSGTVYTLGSGSRDSFSSSTIGSVAWGFDGNNVLFGGSTDDRFYGGSGPDVLTSGTGDDYLFAGGGSGNALSGGVGNDTLDGGDGSGSLRSGPGADTLIVTRGMYTLAFSAGDSSVTNGIDKVVFADNLIDNANAQTFAFSAGLTAQYRVGNVLDPADASSASLLSALDSAYQSKAGTVSNIAVLVEFVNHDNYLVVDSNGGGIGADDYVIKLVGSVPEMTLNNGALVFSPLTS